MLDTHVGKDLSKELAEKESREREEPMPSGETRVLEIPMTEVVLPPQPSSNTRSESSDSKYMVLQGIHRTDLKIPACQDLPGVQNRTYSGH